MLFPSEQTSRPHAWRMTSRETSRPRDRTPRRTTSQAACRRTETPLMAKKHRIRKKSSAPMRPCARRRKKRRPRTGAIQEEASRRTRSTVGDFRIRCFFAIRGTVESSEAMARGRDGCGDGPLGRQARRMVRTPRSRAARAKRQTRPNECLNAHSEQMFHVKHPQRKHARRPRRKRKRPPREAGRARHALNAGPSTPQRPKGRAGCSTRTP